MTKEFKSRLQQQKRGVALTTESSVKKPLHPDQVRLVCVLGSQEYRRTLADHPELEKLMHTFAQVCSYPSVQASLPEISPEESLTLQLRRERELDGVSMDKRHLLLTKTVQQIVRDYLRILLKDTHLTQDQKQDLMKMMR